MILSESMTSDYDLLHNKYLQFTIYQRDNVQVAREAAINASNYVRVHLHASILALISESFKMTGAGWYHIYTYKLYFCIATVRQGRPKTSPVTAAREAANKQTLQTRSP